VQTVEDAQDYPVPAISPDGAILPQSVLGAAGKLDPRNSGLVSMQTAGFVQTTLSTWAFGPETDFTIGVFPTGGPYGLVPERAVTALYPISIP